MNIFIIVISKLLLHSLKLLKNEVGIHNFDNFTEKLIIYSGTRSINDKLNNVLIN